MIKSRLSCLYVLFICIISCSQKQNIYNVYPIIENTVKTDTIFGKIIRNDFSNLENISNKKIKKWFSIQDSVAEKYFSRNPLFNDLENRFKNYSNLSNDNISDITLSESNRYFYLKSDNPNSTQKLYTKKSLGSEEIEIFNPEEFSNQNISYLNPSYNGNRIAIGFKNDGDFTSTVIIYDLKEKKILDDRITNINPDYGGIEWLPESDGFVYLYFPNIDNTQSDFKKNSFSVLHRLGQPKSILNPIFGNKNSLTISKDFYPKVNISSSKDKYAIGYVANSSNFYDAFITSVTDLEKGKPNWVPFFSKNDRIFTTEGEIRNDKFIYRQSSTNGNRLAMVNLEDKNFKNPHVIADGDDKEISQFQCTKDHIYYTKTLNGVEISIYKWESENNLKQLNPPFQPGYVKFIGASIIHNKIGIGIDGWLSPYRRFIIDENDNFQIENLKSYKTFPEFENLKTEQIFAKSHDNLQIPISIIFSDKIKKNGNNEVVIYVYGAYGESLSPFFEPIYLDWVNNGGMLAFAHVRGGGEKGEEWHKMGMKLNKNNSWQDLISCTQELISREYTKKGLICLLTSSAGGITAGMAINKRPDLYSSFIAEVPRMNPYGLEKSASTSSTSYLEYGSVKDSTELKGLIEMDPYLNFRENIQYPSTLILASYNDDRIPLWDSGKYIAKLQQNNLKSTNQYLLDIDYLYGHNKGQNIDPLIMNYSRIFGFAKSNMRH